MQNRADMMGARYAILELFADPNLFPKKLLEKGGSHGNYERISLHASMVWGIRHSLEKRLRSCV